MRERERILERERVLPTIFVDNIHQHTSKKELFNIFKGRQEIVDIFISRKRRINTNHVFAFVRTRTFQEVNQICERCNGIIHRGIKLFVKPARFQQQPSRAQPSIPRPPHPNRPPIRPAFHKTKPQFIPKRSFKDVLLNNNQVPDKTNYDHLQQKIIKVKSSMENLSWLNQSIVLTSKSVRKKEEIYSCMETLGAKDITVRAISPLKFLLTFIHNENIEDFIEKHKEELRLMFHEIKPWSSPERCELREAWIEIRGVPLHLWTEATFEEIARNWGEVLEVHESTREMQSFEKGMVLINTRCMEIISSKAILQSESEGFDIFVKELYIQTHINMDEDPAKVEVEKSGRICEKADDNHSEKGDTDYEINEVPETLINAEESQCNFINGKTDRIIKINEDEVARLETADNKPNPDSNGPQEPFKSGPEIDSINCGQNEPIGPDNILMPLDNTQQSDSQHVDSIEQVESNSDISVPPGFENLIPLTTIEKARRKKKKKAALLSKHHPLKHPGSLKLGLKNPLPKHSSTLTLTPKGVVAFAKKLGLSIEGREEELQRRIAGMLKSERSNWKGSKGSQELSQEQASNIPST